MEVLLKRPLQAVKEEEKKVDLKGEEGEALKQKQIGELLGTASSSTISDLDSKDTTNTKNKEELLESARAEVSGLRQENERLKTLLSRIMKDYESLKNQFITISQRQGQDTNNHQSTDHNMAIAVVEEDHEGELLSLSLGTAKSKSTTHGSKDSEKKADHMDSGDLSLTLAQCSSKAEAGSASTDDPSSDEVLQKDEEEEEEEEGGGEPGKVLGKNCKNNDSELSQLVQVKKARVSVRARCDAPTMNDGCQWRKYGQKISKGNPCPRAYYRCTVAPACPVRKQVQRCAEDMSVLITTYEGTHNHPLPLAATSIASTTSAAASMLLSSSSASTQSLATASLSFGLSQASRPPPSSFHHLSASPSHPPTITLDLTSPTPQFNTSSLGFSPYPSLASGYFNKYNNQLSNNSNSSSTSNLYSNRNPSFSSYLSRTPSGSQEVLTETLARAITADPSFKSALAEALTSIVGGESSGQALAANPTSMSSAANNHLSKPSPALVGERFGYLQSSSSSLGFLTSKGSSSMENLYRD